MSTLEELHPDAGKSVVFTRPDVLTELGQRTRRTILVGLLGDDLLQRHLAPDLLVQEATNQCMGHVDCIDLRKHRHVVRAFRYHHYIVEPGLPASELGILLAYHLGWFDVLGKLRTLLHPLPAFHPLDTAGSHR